MTRQSQQNQQDDRAVTAHFMSHGQNTHNEGISNSIGMLLLRLKRTYFLDATETDLDQAYEACLAELGQAAGEDEAKQAAIANFRVRANETVDPRLNTVTLYENGGSQSYHFPLKRVLTLLWSALQDDTKYTHHYSGTEAEQLTHAQNDRAQRIDGFFNELAAIGPQEPCHTGIRHNLVFLLNEAYEGVHLIEDLRSTVMAFFREQIQKHFWVQYEAAATEQKASLSQALIDWMASANPQALREQIDPQQQIVADLAVLLEQHGIDPDRATEAITSTLAYLPFSADEAHIALNQLAWLLSEAQPPSALAEQALEALRHWVRNNAEAALEAQPGINDAYLYFHTQQALPRYQLLLGQQDLVARVTSEGEAYCQALIDAAGAGADMPTMPDTLRANLEVLKQAMNDCQKKHVTTDVENFFADFFTARNNNDLIAARRGYALLLNPLFQEKVQLPDEAIRAFFKDHPRNANGEITEVDITPYWINRVFLHAILTQPQRWSSLFAEVFHAVRHFVEHDFNAPENRRAALLKRDSYPAPLRAQLKYLAACYTALHSDADRPERPEHKNMVLLLPRDVRTADEWARVYNLLLNEEKREVAYLASRVLIDRPLAGALERDIPLSRVLLFIPERYRKAFAQAQQDWIQNGYQLADVLKRLPKNQRSLFAIKYQNKIRSDDELAEVKQQLPEAFRLIFNTTYQYKIQSAGQVVYLLKYLPEGQRLEFVITHQEKIQTGVELAHILNYLPEDQRFAFAVAHQDKIKDAAELADVLRHLLGNQQLEFATRHQEKIQNGNDLVLVLKQLPEDQRLKFAVAHQAKIENAHQLADVLGHLPENQCLTFAMLHRNKIQKDHELNYVLRRLPETCQSVFEEIYQNKFQNGVDLAQVLEQLPENQRLAFAMLHRDKIQKPAELILILKRLPEADRLELANACQDKIQNDQHRAFLSNYLPEADRAKFTTPPSTTTSHRSPRLFSNPSQTQSLGDGGEGPDKDVEITPSPTSLITQ